MLHNEEWTGIPHRLKLQGAIDGQRYAWLAMGGLDEDWSIPTHKYQLQEIIGDYLMPLERCFCGDNLIPAIICSQCKLPVQPAACTCHKRPLQLPIGSCEHCPHGKIEAAVSKAKVNAFVDKHGQIRMFGTLADHSLADSDNVASVIFGDYKCREDFETKPSADLTRIQTPPSPCSTDCM